MFVSLSVVSACAANNGSVPAGEIYDPQEVSNRKVHEFNRGVDRVLFRPVSNGYGNVVHEDARLLVSNFADHLSLPADIVNNILQGDLKGAGANSFRFVFNTVFGFGGIADPSDAFDMPRRETDFGETFHVWGMKEGAYVELPLLGPSTERDAMGTILDFTLDPVSVLLPNPESYIGTAANIADRMGDRYELRGTIDSVLYESADSYAQTRILYLQNRRFELGVTADDAYLDPYDDPYAE
ncbi:MlaA family lipoprotein [Cognatishimia maritima]|uniref:MlaA family lipoprotein n=1 Tax=Cognatishimia maritima TaxID=870908 RepID=UPI001F61F9BF|nr:VacJ family lipoprotein [Cognatishimia maritima]